MSKYSQLKIGVLALQGAVSEHAAQIKSLDAKAIAVKNIKQLDGLDGIIFPGGEESHLNLMDITVQRNAFGRQVDSFQMPLKVKGINETFPAVFIRAPYVQSVDSDRVEILAKINENPVLVKQGNLLACSFHPELTQDSRILELFFEMFPH